MGSVISLFFGVVAVLLAAAAHAGEISFLQQAEVPVELAGTFEASLRPEPYKTPPRDLVAVRIRAKDVSKRPIVAVFMHLVTVDAGGVRRHITALSLDPLAPGYAGDVDFWVSSGDRSLLAGQRITLAWVDAVVFHGGGKWYAEHETVIEQLASFELALAKGRHFEPAVPDPDTTVDGARRSAAEEATIMEIARHVFDMYDDSVAGERPKIKKWNKPVRYFYGRLNDAANRAFLEATMHQISDLTGLTIERAKRPDDAVDLFLIFTDEFVTQMQEGLLRRLFKHPGESEETYRARMAAVRPSGGSILWTGSNEESVLYHVAVVNARGLPDNKLPAQIVARIFDAFTFAGNSDRIKPSLANIGISSESGALPEIDKAFLRALYSPDIRHGMSLTEALPLIAARMHAILYPESNIPAAGQH